MMDYDIVFGNAVKNERKISSIDIITNLGPKTYRKNVEFDKAEIFFPESVKFGIMLFKDGKLVACIRENVPFVVEWE